MKSWPNCVSLIACALGLLSGGAGSAEAQTCNCTWSIDSWHWSEAGQCSLITTVISHPPNSGYNCTTLPTWQAAGGAFWNGQDGDNPVAVYYRSKYSGELTCEQWHASTRTSITICTTSGTKNEYRALIVPPNCGTASVPDKFQNSRSARTVAAVSAFLPGQVQLHRRAPEGWQTAWSRDGGETFLSDGPTGSGSTVTGAATPVLRIDGINVQDEGTYAFCVSPPGGEVEPVSECTVFVDRSIPTVTSNPRSVEVCEGGVAEFRVGATEPGLLFRWYFDAMPVINGPGLGGIQFSGQGTPVLTLTGVASMSPRRVYCVVSNSEYRVETLEAELRVGSVVAAPTISRQAVSTRFCIGALATVSIGVDEVQGAIYSYQWRKDGQPLQDDGRRWGSNWPTLEIESFGPGDEGQYDCIVTRACLSVASDPATLVITSADFDGDGDIGTDFDIQAFFACLGGNCCPACGSADFDGDGDTGTDFDIQAFFRVLGGGNC